MVMKTLQQQAPRLTIMVAITLAMQPRQGLTDPHPLENSTTNMNTMTTSKRMGKRYANVDECRQELN